MAAPLASDTINVRKISWTELWKLRPDLKPANDNKAKEERSGTRQ
ncbi:MULTISPECIES: hypothetical protein [unclassified Mesorhizobium]|nr:MULTISPECIES: hypothetical protein [unclassified Mesorhizobium]